jgi:hypothetical protein
MPSFEIEEGRGQLRRKRLIPLSEEWEHMQDMIGGDRSPQKDAHRKKLFGSTTIQNTDMFIDIQLGAVEGIPSYHDFQELDLHIRAKYLAFARLSSMSKIIDRHHDILEANYRKMLAKINSKNK